MKLNLLVLIFSLCLGLTHLKGAGPGCDSQLFWFHVQHLLDLECGEVQFPAQFDYSLNPQDDGDNIPEATEISLAISDDMPCADQVQLACALGFAADQLEKNPATGKWQPKRTEVQNYKCCLRRAWE